MSNSVVSRIKNNELPGFYSIAIEHPIRTQRGVMQLIRQYAVEDLEPGTCGDIVVFNSAAKIYERVVIRGWIEHREVFLDAYRPGDTEVLLGRVKVTFIEDIHYGPELPNGAQNVVPYTCVSRIDSFDHTLEGLGTLLMQGAMELEDVCQGRVALEAYPGNFPFYYKLGMRWRGQPIREYDPALYKKARQHMLSFWNKNEDPPEGHELTVLYNRVKRLTENPEPDCDAIILKEMEDARAAGRKPDTTKLVPKCKRLYFPDDAIKVWQKVIAERPVLYKT